MKSADVEEGRGREWDGEERRGDTEERVLNNYQGGGKEEDLMVRVEGLRWRAEREVRRCLGTRAEAGEV